jgi:TetR/AcrR family transcriptional repressor of nem operon
LQGNTALNKRETLLNTGKQAILEKGYSATSVDEICEASGVTKGAFFYYFKSKEHFVSALLEYVWQSVIENREALLQEVSHPPKRLTKQIDDMIQFILSDGRLVPIVASELSQTHPDIGAQCRGYFMQWMGFHVEDVEHAQVFAQVQNFDAKGLVAHIMSFIEGLSVIANFFGEPGVEQAIFHQKQYLSLLFEPTNS